ncbi:hypothetical protein GCM10011529_13570 [Polymorphobacter glacialis]|uniref:Transporter n=1 Tax=Sandarakinorhabdus glacialis TaxID=1614636 RepID=A0A917E678_9SPHN|nr:hypothetical protein [Polymorphobacter glacialis]GGE08424.1 hypothetical protein GCM10011529_13570 [Polymorphobacter glacialis]
MIPLRAGLAASLLLAGAPLHAAGGPSLVDDAGTVTPGTCELETYGNFDTGKSWRTVLSPTCALSNWRGVEVGIIAALQSAIPGDPVDVVPGVAVKAQLGKLGPISFGAEISAGFDPEGNQSQYIATNLATSFDTPDWLELHANAGMDFEPGRAGIPTWGLAVLLEPVSNWQFVAEAAGRSRFRTRTQAGIRRTAGAFVLDLPYSRNIDEQRGGASVSAGVTWTFGL